MRALPVVVAVLLLVVPVAGTMSSAAGSESPTVVEAPGSVAVDSADPSAVAVDPAGSSAGYPLGSSRPQTGPSQVDESNLTFRTLSAPADADSRVGSASRGANLGSALSLSLIHI